MGKKPLVFCLLKESHRLAKDQFGLVEGSRHPVEHGKQAEQETFLVASAPSMLIQKRERVASHFECLMLVAHLHTCPNRPNTYVDAMKVMIVIYSQRRL